MKTQKQALNKHIKKGPYENKIQQVSLVILDDLVFSQQSYVWWRLLIHRADRWKSSGLCPSWGEGWLTARRRRCRCRPAGVPSSPALLPERLWNDRNFESSYSDLLQQQVVSLRHVSFICTPMLPLSIGAQDLLTHWRLVLNIFGLGLWEMQVTAKSNQSLFITSNFFLGGGGGFLAKSQNAAKKHCCHGVCHIQNW